MDNLLKIAIQTILNKAKSKSNINSNLKELEKTPFYIKIISKLDKNKSKSEIKKNLKEVENGNLSVNIFSKLDKSKSKSEIKKAIREIENGSDTSVHLKAILNNKETLNQIKNTLKNLNTNINVKADEKPLNTVAEGLEKVDKRSLTAMASLRLMQEALYGLERAAREMVITAASLDRQLTDLRLVTGDNYNEAARVVLAYNELAHELSSTTSQVLNASNDWLRQGKTIAETNELITQSMILSKVGAMSAEDATTNLTSAMKGYGLEVQNVAGIVDQLTSIDLEAAVSSSDLSIAMSHTASSANIAGVEMNKLLGYLGAVIETTQKAPSSIGESFKTIFARMGNIKLGRFLDDDSNEDLSDVESTLKHFRITLRDTKDEFKDFDTILETVGERWKEFTNVEQRAIAQAFGGVRQYENVLVLFENWGKALELAEVAANSAGTSLERFAIYEDSLEAKTNKLKNALESLSFNTLDSNFLKSLTDIGTATIKVVDNLNLLKTSIIAIATISAGKGLGSLYNHAKSLYVQVNQLNNAFNLMKGVAKEDFSSEQMTQLTNATKNLTTSQLRLVLSNKALDEVQRVQLLVSRGLTDAEARQTLATYGLISAEKGAATSTGFLTGAFKSLTAAIAANPIGFALLAITSLVSITTSVVSKFNQSQEEMLQNARDSANALKEETDTLENQKNKILELRTALDKGNLSQSESNEKRKELYSIQKDLLDQYGKEAEGINTITGSLNELNDVIDKLNRGNYEKFLRENQTAINESKKYFESQASEFIRAPGEFSTFRVWDKNFSEQVKKEVDVLQGYFADAILSPEKNISFTGTPTEVLKKYEDLSDAIREANKNATGELKKDTDNFLGDLSNTISNLQNEIIEYENIYKKYIEGRVKHEDSYSFEYESILKTRADLEKAQLSGNREEIKSAQSALFEALNKGIEKAGEDTGVATYFRNMYLDLQNEFNKYQFELSFNINKDEVVVSIDNALKSLLDLKSGEILQIDEIGGTEEQISAYNSLADIAEQYDIKVKDLIDTLVILGKIEASPVIEVEPVNTFSTTLEDLTSKTSLLSKALAEQSANGKISSETYADLIANGDDYKNLVDVTKDGCILLTDKTKDYINELVKQAIQMAIANDATEEQIKLLTDLLLVSSSLADALSSLSDYTEKYNNVIDDLNNGNGLTLQSYQNLLNLYPELEQSLSKYLLGLISEIELQQDIEAVTQNKIETQKEAAKIRALLAIDEVNAVAKAYEIDGENFQSVEEFKNAILNSAKFKQIGITDDIVNEKAKSYGIDLENFKEVEKLKVQLANESTKKQIEFYQKELMDGRSVQGEIAIREKITDLKSQLLPEDFIDLIYKAKEANISTTFDTSKSNSKSSSLPKLPDTSKFYNEQLKDLEKNLTSLEEKIAKIQSALTRAEAFGNEKEIKKYNDMLIRAKNEQIETYQNMLESTRDFQNQIKSTFSEFEDVELTDFGIAKYNQNIKNQITALQNTNANTEDKNLIKNNEIAIQGLEAKLSRFNEYVSALETANNLEKKYLLDIQKINDENYTQQIKLNDEASNKKLEKIEEAYKKTSDESALRSKLVKLSEDETISLTQALKIKEKIADLDLNTYDRALSDIEYKGFSLKDDDFTGNIQLEYDKIRAAEEAIAYLKSQKYKEESDEIRKLRKDIITANNEIVQNTKSIYDIEYDDLKEQYDKGLISAEEYRNELIAFDKKYYAKNKDYINEHENNLKEINNLQRTIYDDEQSRIEHSIELLAKKDGTEKLQIDSYKQLQENIQTQMDYYISIGINKNHKYIQELESQWLEYQDKIISITENIYNSAIKVATATIDEQINNLQKVNDGISDEINNLEKNKSAWENTVNYIVSLIDEQISGVEKLNGELSEQVSNLQKIRSNWETTLKYITSLIDEQISGIEKINSGLSEEVNQLEKVSSNWNKAINASVNVIDDKIKSLQDEKCFCQYKTVANINKFL